MEKLKTKRDSKESSTLKTKGWWICEILDRPTNGIRLHSHSFLLMFNTIIMW